MCGIAGIITKDGSLPSEECLSLMSESIIHRGPDDDGMWIEGGVGFAHRRLAIIDLTERGAQPMHSADGRFVLVYNGEVYNYIELRKELESTGISFQSDSDTEVVMESYRQWGKDAVKKFRGMFAFAIWDRQERNCFFARDRVGKKPFFYRVLSNGSFCFASELKALRLLESVEPDPHAIRLFFGMQYVPSPKTGFLNIFSLPPGYCGTIDASGFQTEPYHSWDESREAMSGDPVKDVFALLEESVRIRLRADVTIGAMLSGGIDSAAIVGLAQRNSERSIRTFTMGFPDIGMDERKEARSIAEFFHTDHQDFVAQPEDLIAMTEQLIFQYGGPYADSSALPVMMLSREIAKEIKVVLVGDGGDELFGGYRRYSAFLAAQRLASVPGTKSMLPPLLRAASSAFHDPRYNRMASTLRGASDCLNRAYAEMFCGSYFDTGAAKRILTQSFFQEYQQDDPVDYIAGHMGNKGTAIGRAMRFDFESYLADDLNVKMDRATMAYSLEARAPFLDTQLAGYVMQLPSSLHFRRGKGKILLKQALEDFLPEEVLRRRKKGFQVPLASWFRKDPLASYWKDRCLDPKSSIRDYVKQDAIKQLFEANMRGADYGNRLWMLLSLAVWLDGIAHE